MNRLVAFFNALNTHHVFGIGLGTALGGIAALALKTPIDAQITAHAGVSAPLIQQYVDGALNQYAQPALIIGAGLLGAGRPFNVPSGPVLPQAVVSNGVVNRNP